MDNFNYYLKQFAPIIVVVAIVGIIFLQMCSCSVDATEPLSASAPDNNFIKIDTKNTAQLDREDEARMTSLLILASTLCQEPKKECIVAAVKCHIEDGNGIWGPVTHLIGCLDKQQNKGEQK